MFSTATSILRSCFALLVGKKNKGVTQLLLLLHRFKLGGILVGDDVDNRSSVFQFLFDFPQLTQLAMAEASPEGAVEDKDNWLLAQNLRDIDLLAIDSR